MTTIKDFIDKFNLKDIELFDYTPEDTLTLEHIFLINALGILPGMCGLQIIYILEARLFLKKYFEDLKQKPLQNIIKKDYVLIPSVIEDISPKFIFTFTSVSVGLGISKKELNKFLKESLILISGQPSDDFPKNFYQIDDRSIMLNYNGYDWIVKNYIYNNSGTSDS